MSLLQIVCHLLVFAAALIAGGLIITTVIMTFRLLDRLTARKPPPRGMPPPGRKTPLPMAASIEEAQLRQDRLLQAALAELREIELAAERK